MFLILCLVVILGTTVWEKRLGWSWADILGSQSIQIGLAVFAGAQALLPPATAFVVGAVSIALSAPAGLLHSHRMKERRLREALNTKRLAAFDPATQDERTPELLLQLADEVDASVNVRARRLGLLKWLVAAGSLGVVGTLLGSWPLGLGALGTAVYGWARIRRAGKPMDDATDMDLGPPEIRPGLGPGSETE